MMRNYKTASWVTSEEIVIKPSPNWNSKSYQVNRLTNVEPLDDNFSFDLGNFRFEVRIVLYLKLQQKLSEYILNLIF